MTYRTGSEGGSTSGTAREGATTKRPVENPIPVGTARAWLDARPLPDDGPLLRTRARLLRERAERAELLAERSESRAAV